MPRTVPAAVTETVGNFWTAAKVDAEIRDLNSFILNPPVFIGYQSSAQTISNGVWTSITIDTEVTDTDSGHSNSVNPSRYTATVPGLYLVAGGVSWNNNATGYRRARLAKNGSNVRGVATGFDVNTSNVAGGIALAFITMNGSTDYVEVMGSQASGGNLLTSTATDLGCTLSLYWISN